VILYIPIKTSDCSIFSYEIKLIQFLERILYNETASGYKILLLPLFDFLTSFKQFFTILINV